MTRRAEILELFAELQASSREHYQYIRIGDWHLKREFLIDYKRRLYCQHTALLERLRQHYAPAPLPGPLPLAGHCVCGRSWGTMRALLTHIRYHRSVRRDPEHWAISNAIR